MTKKKKTAAIVLVLAVLLIGGSVYATSHWDGHSREQLISEIETRDALISSQESLLNTYRCLFDIDTHIVPGGCSVEPDEPEPESDQDDLFTGNVTTCEAEHRIGNTYWVTIEGTITANRAYEAVTMRMELTGTAAGQELPFRDYIFKSRWAAGESVDFELFGLLDLISTSGGCNVSVDWESTTWN